MLARVVLVLLLALPFVAAVLIFIGNAQRHADTKPFDAHRDLSSALPVFPGAEGFGTDTPAGRGGAILRVTTLAGEGPGSLRAAIETPGPRTIVFEVAGIIESPHLHVIAEPFVTIAGQTAPPPGITIAGTGIDIVAHDVLIQHLRLRVGDDPEGPHPDSRDGIGVHQGGRRVVIDHCSIAWAIDEGTSTWGTNLEDITFSNCIIAENLSRSLHSKGEHSKGLLIGDNTRRIAVLNNLFAHNMRRNPLVKGNVSLLVANNLIYNPGKDAIRWSDPERSGPSVSAVLNNLVIPGPDTSGWLAVFSRDFRLSRDTRIFARDNAIEMNEAPRAMGPGATLAGVLVDEPPVTLEPLTLIAIEELEEHILASAGAWSAARDAVDARIVASVRERAGGIIDSPDEVGGMPAVAPVFHELALPADPHGDANGNGYTNLEEWLHALAARAEGQIP